MLVGPAALALVLFIFLPVAAVFILAFTDYRVGAPGANWIGLENFATLFGGRLGRNALINTLVYAAIVIQLKGLSMRLLGCETYEKAQAQR